MPKHEYKTRELAEEAALKLEEKKKYKGLKSHISKMSNGRYCIYMY